MRNFYILIYFVILFPFITYCQVPSKKKSFPVIPNIPTQTTLLSADQLEEMAARLALRFLNENRLDEDSVFIAESIQNSVYNGLLAIVGSSNSAVDSIFRIHQLQPFPKPNVRKLVLLCQLDQNWVRPLLTGDKLTGNEALNETLAKYKLETKAFNSIDNLHGGWILYANKPLNINALSRLFLDKHDIGTIRELQPFPTGDDIEIDVAKDKKSLIYSFHLQRVPTAFSCPKRQSWSFQVNEQGEMIYLGEQGDIQPPWMMSASLDLGWKIGQQVE